ncbi:MAG: Glycerate dehydrogenase [Bacteroidota bacterium]|jgi:glycerate dehydrogenase
MKILVLDGYTLFQEDIKWNGLRDFGEIDFRERLHRSELSSCDPETSVIITNKALVGIPELEFFKSLQLVIVSATGYNCVDVKACAERNIPVCNVPAYGTYSVAQHALSMLLHYSNQVALHDASVKKGEWASNKDWSYTLTPIKEWHGKTIGIIGMGNIGSCLAGMAESLGMKVIYYHTRDMGLANRQYVDLSALASSADVISLHCPLNASTDKLINENFLAKMKSSAVLINTSRGGLIDNQALRAALLENRIAAALLDVLDQEPPPAQHPLVGLQNVIITPHIAWISFEARQRIFEAVQSILSSFKAGEIINKVN